MGGLKCELSVKYLAICQLSVFFSAFCQLSVKFSVVSKLLFMINRYMVYSVFSRLGS